MNRQQIVEVIKGLLVAGGPVTIILINLLGMQSGTAENIVQGLGALVSVAGIVWMALGKSNTAMVKDAASVPGVQVHAQPGVAPQAVLDVARDKKDPTTADVVVMTGGPVDPKK